MPDTKPFHLASTRAYAYDNFGGKFRYDGDCVAVVEPGDEAVIVTVYAGIDSDSLLEAIQETAAWGPYENVDVHAVAADHCYVGLIATHTLPLDGAAGQIATAAVHVGALPAGLDGLCTVFEIPLCKWGACTVFADGTELGAAITALCATEA